MLFIKPVQLELEDKYCRELSLCKNWTSYSWHFINWLLRDLLKSPPLALTTLSVTALYQSFWPSVIWCQTLAFVIIPFTNKHSYIPLHKVWDVVNMYILWWQNKYMSQLMCALNSSKVFRSRSLPIFIHFTEGKAPARL